jgi:acyl-coenzyme A thioesterase PaaI-like protein
MDGRPNPLDVDSARSSARALASALRALTTELVDLDIPQETAEALRLEVEELRAKVRGPHRPRYYECAEVAGARAAFVDYSPISGRSHPLAHLMEVEWATGPDGAPGVLARMRIGLAHEGPPHGVHGGVVAAIFDELLGHAQQVHGVRALTANLTVRYRAVTPIDEELEWFACVVHSSGRRWSGRATCTARGVLTAEADALFVGVDLGSIGTA